VTHDGYQITERREGAGVVRVCPAGEFDVDNQDDLGQALVGAVRDPSVSHVVVDLSGSTFMGSCGLNAMVMAYNTALSLNKCVRVINCRPAVRRVFDATGLTDLLITD
jgi:stage II sporulation protein AA (anti-sigma F factor antagonist)